MENSKYKASCNMWILTERRSEEKESDLICIEILQVGGKDALTG